MVRCHAEDRLLLYLTDLEALHLSCLAKLTLELRSYTTNETHWKIVSTISRHIPTEESTKTRQQQLMNALVFAMFNDERHQRSQETIGLWLAIHSVDDGGRSQLKSFQKGFTEAFRQLAFQQIADQRLAQHSTTAFIAQNPAQWRYIGDNLFAIIKT